MTIQEAITSLSHDVLLTLEKFTPAQSLEILQGLIEDLEVSVESLEEELGINNEDDDDEG